MTQDFLVARRSLIADAVQRRRELQDELRSEQSAIYDAAIELAEAANAIDGEQE